MSFFGVTSTNKMQPLHNLRVFGISGRDLTIGSVDPVYTMDTADARCDWLVEFIGSSPENHANQSHCAKGGGLN